MNKDPFIINLLLDMYESLLTEKQRMIMQLHYREDFSLAEISDEVKISRAGVLDHIQRAIKTLYEYEEHLHLLKRNEQLKSLIASLKPHVDEEGSAYINKLEDLLS